MTESGAPHNEILTGVYVSTHPTALIVRVSTAQKKYIGRVMIDFTAVMTLRDQGEIRQTIQFTIDIYDPGDEPEVPDVFVGVNTTPYFANPTPSDVTISLYSRLVLDLASLVPFDDQDNNIEISI